MLHVKAQGAAMGSEGRLHFTHKDGGWTQNIYFGWKTPWWGTNRVGARVVDGTYTDSCLWLHGDSDTHRDNTLTLQDQWYNIHYKMVGTAQIVRDESSPLVFFRASKQDLSLPIVPR